MQGHRSAVVLKLLQLQLHAQRPPCMAKGPGSKVMSDPQQNSGMAQKGGWGEGRAEASTLLHESSNSEPETI